MKTLFAFIILTFLCLSCDKEKFDTENPDVKLFVQQLKNGTYDVYETGEDGEKLWTIMPEFSNEDIPALLEFSQDTTLVCPCRHFPVNPISSIPPWRVVDENGCIMMCEYLLWCVEGIIRNNTYASLTPTLVLENSNDRLTGKEILEIVKLYEAWWNKYGTGGNTSILPLDKTDYYWI